MRDKLLNMRNGMAPKPDCPYEKVPEWSRVRAGSKSPKKKTGKNIRKRY